MIREFFVGFRKGFKEFGHFVSSIVNFILLLPVYVIGIGLVSVVSKLFRKEFLDLGKKKKKSYWLDNRIGKKKKEDCYRTF